MYDYIILDTAPNATPPTVAAYKAADYFVLTAQPEPWAVEGLNEAMRDIKAVQGRGNEKLQLLGVIVASVDKRTRLAIALTEYVERVFGATKFQTTISRSTIVPDSQRARKTLFQSAPLHLITDQYRQLAQEIETRIASVTGSELHAAFARSVVNG
jgi:chromosome partitioning protein